MTYANLQTLLAEVNDNIGFELYALRYSGKGHCLILYEDKKLIARGRTAVEREIIDLHISFCKGLL